VAKVEWTRDAELVSVAHRVFRSPAAATAVVVLEPGSKMTATAGCDHDSALEIASISKALTGMLYRNAIERGLLSQATVLQELLPLEGDGKVGSVSLGSLAIHRSGLSGLSPGMRPLRRTLRFWATGENPYGDSLTDPLSQVRRVRVGSPRPRYSNLGFQLLGHAVAEAAGKSYEQLLQDALGGGFRAPVRQEDLGPKDLIGVNRFGRPQQAWVGEALAPAGGIRASITTTGEFLRSILNGTVRGLTALDPVADFAPRVSIGAGWITMTHRNRPLTWHNGSTGGFSSWIGVNRDAGTAAAVLTAAHRSVDRQGFRLEL
jgi:CubicO group peptidase (beta-lactamase class C family)